MSAPTGAPRSPTKPFYAYVAVDIRTDPALPVFIEITRHEARKRVQWHVDADHLRIKRTFCRPFEK